MDVKWSGSSERLIARYQGCCNREKFDVSTRDLTNKGFTPWIQELSMEGARPVLPFSQEGWLRHPGDFEPRVVLPCRANLQEAHVQVTCIQSAEKSNVGTSSCTYGHVPFTYGRGITGGTAHHKKIHSPATLALGPDLSSMLTISVLLHMRSVLKP